MFRLKDRIHVNERSVEQFAKRSVEKGHRVFLTRRFHRLLSRPFLSFSLSLSLNKQFFLTKVKIKVRSLIVTHTFPQRG